MEPKEEIAKVRVTSTPKIMDLLIQSSLSSPMLTIVVDENELKSFIVAVTNESFFLKIPFSDGKTFELEVGSTFIGKFLSKDGICEFSGKIKGVVESFRFGFMKMVKIEPVLYEAFLPSEIIVLERRKYTRYKVKDLWIEVTIQRGGFSFKGLLDNISVGGFSIAFPFNKVPKHVYPNINEEVRFSFMLKLVDAMIEGIGLIRHYSVDKDSGNIVCGLSFTEMSEEMKDKISKFIELIEKR
jgi:c-di-GMP-binding flagellar brake protein YcgR